MLADPPESLLMRKPVALLLIGFVATASHAENKFNILTTPGRLPKDVVPRSYLIHLEPNIETLVTDGFESIEIEVLKPTDHIVLNAVDTEISAVKIAIDDRKEELTPQFDSNQQTVSLALQNILKPGVYTLSFKFQSRIGEQPHGLFIQHYDSHGALEHVLATEMEPGDARRVFPCWDEPVFRAIFQLSVKTGKENTVVSNMPIFVEVAFGTDEKIVVFEKTPPMSSYLALLACGKFEWLEDEVAGVKLRIMTTTGKKGFGRYALEITKKLLGYYSDYFAVPYPLPKLDQLAFPSGFGGAMEDWGGVTYNEDTLLFDPETSSESTKQEIFLVIAHELAHQWLGDLVTMAWWNDLWLNEGLASWMQAKAADHFNPEWKVWLYAAGQKERAMAFDARKITHPIQQPVADEDEAKSAFDVITYQKACFFLRMLESFFGEQPFRAGIRAYLAAHQYSNTTTEDFWESLEFATGKPVKKIASGWTEQPGFPLIKVTTQCVRANRVISLEQVPFALAEEDNAPTEWTVPAGIRSTENPSEVKYALLEKLSNNFDFPGCTGAIQANAGNIGYFRVLYEPALFNDLQKNVEKLPESDRLNLVTDTWALVESGNVPVSSYFDLLDNLRRDDSYAVWQSALGERKTTGALQLIDRLEQGRPGRETYQKYICGLFIPKLQELGWDERSGEDAETRRFRAMLIETLGFFGDRAVIDESFKRFEKFRDDPSSLPPNLRSPVTAIVGRYSSQIVYEELLSMTDAAQTAAERRTYMRALSVALDPELAHKTLEYLMSDHVMRGDACRALEDLATEGEHPEVVWEFATTHLSELQQRFGLLRRNRLLSSIAGGFMDEARADELIALAKSYLAPVAIREAEDSANLIRFRAKLKAKTLPAIDDWMKTKGDGAPSKAAANL
jgi:aminopeptidase N